jgi:non-ribosomal peptide synthetase component F
MLTSLRHVNYGGEAVRPAAVAAMRQAAPCAELHDAYGPTEASVITTSFLCNDYGDAVSVPIGR